MRVVLQHAKTALYLKRAGTWTTDVSAALDFGSSKRAIKYLKQNNLWEVQVLVAFVEPTCIDTVALQLPAPPPEAASALRPAARWGKNPIQWERCFWFNTFVVKMVSLGWAVFWWETARFFQGKVNSP